MAHFITPGPHPNIVIMKIEDDLTYADMTADEPLGLNEGRPLCVLLDVTQMNVGLPEGFLDGAKHSYFMNDNLVHMALVTDSQALRLIGNMVAKVTRRKEKLSVHSSYDSAIHQLLQKAQEVQV